MAALIDALCRDCAEPFAVEAARPSGGWRCPACKGPRVIAHAELHRLSMAHIDCDAFYASVEKRDNPALIDRPVIVGGGKRGVVAACCYIARMKGVRSAMPTGRAYQLCPEAVVIRPRIARYREVGRAIRELMRSTTPLVEPLSLDEAFLDLAGTERLHHGSPARTLVRLIRRIETEIGVTASVGLSYNKFLAKVASDLDKPRGFAVLGRADAPGFLARQPVTLIWGVGKALAAELNRDGIATIAQLRELDERILIKRYGAMGRRLFHFARGEDDRAVLPSQPAKSISAEVTFDIDIADADELRHRLWPLCEEVAGRLKRSGVAARGLTLKLKTSGFRLITRSLMFDAPTRLAETLFQSALPLLAREADGRHFRLIGIGGSHLTEDLDAADPPDLLDLRPERRAKVEDAIDAVRARFGEAAILKGRGLGARTPSHLGDLKRDEE